MTGASVAERYLSRLSGAYAEAAFRGPRAERVMNLTVSEILAHLATKLPAAIERAEAQHQAEIGDAP